MKKYMRDTVDSFFATKVVGDVDRSTYLTCNLRDKEFKLDISLIFMSDWDVLEPDNYSQIILQYKGAVLVFPCYWVSVPKELAMAYFEYIIDKLYTDDGGFNSWYGISSGSSSSNFNGCNCPCV